MAASTRPRSRRCARPAGTRTPPPPSASARSCWAWPPTTTSAPRAPAAGRSTRWRASTSATAPGSSASTGSATPRAKGLREAAGLMVNYLYDLRFIEANHEAFANHGTVVASDAVKRHLPAPPPPSTPRRPPMSENLFETFRAAFPPTLPSRPFLERPDGSALSYADLLDLSGRLANVLVDLGVKPGDRVAAQVEKSAEALMVYLASLARRGRLPAAQHRLHGRRDPLLPRRRRAHRLRLPARARRSRCGPSPPSSACRRSRPWARRARAA